MNCRRILYILLGLFLAGCPHDPVPYVAFSADPTTPLVGDLVTFTNTSIYATSYQWEFGDGTSPSSDENPTHTYTTAGTFTVKLKAIGDGGSSSTSIPITVSYLIPEAEFTMNKSTAKEDEVIIFTNESINAESYAWDFGDGSTSTDFNETHSYAAVGNYTVELTATGDGGSDSESKVITILHPPEAAFYMDKSTADVGETIKFTNISNYATSYSWDFGDGSTSTDFNETHSYAAEGNYTVQLTATGEGGVDSESHNVSIVPIILTNILPGIGIRDIELGETWATVEAKMGDDVDYLGYYIDNSNYLHHIWESLNLGVKGYLVSPTASYSPSSDDILWLIVLHDNFIGQTAENIRMGSLLSEVVAAYGDPDRYDTTYDSYFYDRLGIRFYYNGSNIIDYMTVYPADSKKRTGIPYSQNEDLRNIKSRLQK